MAIRDKSLDYDSVAEGQRALDLFTDRYELIRLYTSYLNEDPQPERVIYLHGDGGNGKSLLLRYLKQRCTNRVRPATWQELQVLQGSAFVDNIADCQNAAPIPSALLDFGLAPHGSDSPQDVFSALLILRRALTADWLRFPLFDYACVLHLHMTGRLTDENLHMLFPSEEMDFITEIASALVQSKWLTPANVVLKLFGKHMRRQLTLRRKRRKLDEETVSKLNAMDPHFQLVDELPELFAEDLNAAVAAPGAVKRAALLFDSHETFWGDRQDYSEDLYHQRDEWLRRLITSLELQSGITVVVAGRDAPRWHSASRYPVPKEFVELRHIGGLPDAEAAEFLTRAGVGADDLRTALIDYARIAPGESHPFMLALAADVVRAAAARNEPVQVGEFLTSGALGEKQAALLERLLRYVPYEVKCAVRALSACRTFDLDTYLMLGRDLNFHATAPSFELLCRFSFVWPTSQQGAARYRIHDLARRILAGSNDNYVQGAHRVLEQYYTRRSAAGDITDFAEAVYHASKTDWKRAIESWVRVFEVALGSGRYDQCQALMDLRNELPIEEDYWRMLAAQYEGDYLKTISQYDAAIQSYTVALNLSEALIAAAPEGFHGYYGKGLVLQKLSYVYTLLSQYDQALEAYHSALRLIEQAIRISPDQFDAHNILGIGYTRIGDLQGQLSKYEQAVDSYTTARNIFDRAIQLAPDYIDLKGNKATCLMSLGALYLQLSRYDEAAAAGDEAIATYDDLLKNGQDIAAIHSNRGMAYTFKGRLLTKLSRSEAAIEAFRQSVAAFDAGMALSPDMVEPYNNKANVLINLGEAQAAKGDYADAIETLSQAVQSCDAALERAPRSVNAYNTRGLASLRLAESQQKQSKYQEARLSLNQAIAAFDAVLQQSPQMLPALANKSVALREAGNVAKTLTEYEEATQYYDRAVQAADSALQAAPHFINGYTNKALALLDFAEMKARMGEDHIAIFAYREVLTALSKASTAAPNDLTLKSMRAHTLNKLGLRQFHLKQYGEAADNFAGALYIADQIITKDPESTIAYNTRGLCSINLGLVSMAVDDDERALAFYEQGLAAYADFQKRAPDEPAGFNNMANGLIRLGELHAKRGRFDEAVSAYRRALAACDQCLERAPEYPVALGQRSLAYLKLSEVHEATGELDEARTALAKGREAVLGALCLAKNEAEFWFYLNRIEDGIKRLSEEQADQA